MQPLRLKFPFKQSRVCSHLRDTTADQASSGVDYAGEEGVFGSFGRRDTAKQHGVPEIINSDQRSQFTSQEYVEYFKRLKTCQISMDGKGRAIDNVYVEQFFRIIKY